MFVEEVYFLHKSRLIGLPSKRHVESEKMRTFAAVMTRDDAIKYCRYYHGEKECPKRLIEKNRGYLFWVAERMWVESEDKTDTELLTLAVNCELTDEQMLLNGVSSKLIDIPFNLRCYLFSEYCRHSDIDPLLIANAFVEKILNEYLS